MLRVLPSRRRGLRLIAALVATTVAMLGLYADGAPDPIDVSVEVGSTPVSAGLPDGFLGLSLEFSAIHRYVGRDANAPNPVFLQLVHALDPSGAPVLRIGGDSTDHSWLALPGLVEPVGVSYAITPDWMATVHRTAAALGARLLLGINLAADNPQVAGVEARALLRGVGRRYVSALEIGNEPDVYAAFAWYRSRRAQIGFARAASDWTEEAFLRQFSHWAAALPPIPLAGPADAYSSWMEGLPGFLATEPRLGVVTFHRYPLRACGTEDRGQLAATIPHLLDDASSSGLARGVAPFAAVAHAGGLPFRVDELNSASCGGAAGVSDTFASALWMLDTLFELAAVGVDGVNVHTLPGAAYAPFSFTRRGQAWRGDVAPLYYGMLMFRRAFPTGGRLLAVSASAPGLRTWATRAPDGTVRTVLINDSPNDPAVVHLHVAGLAPGQPLSAQTLTAPGLAATSGVSLGRARFAPNTITGRLAPPYRSTLRPVLGRYELAVAPASAVLLSS